MFFRQKFVLKSYLPFFSMNYRILRTFHTSYSVHIRRLKKENCRSLYEFPGENVNSINIQEGTGSTRNFYGIENDEGVITVDESRSVYVNELVSPLSEKQREEMCYKTTFGILRRDSENKLEYHGQYEDSILNSEFMHTTAKSMSATGTAYNLSARPSIQNGSLKQWTMSQSELHASVEREKIHTTDNSKQRERVFETLDENMSGVSEFHTQSEVKNVSQNQEPDLNYIDQFYFSDGVENSLDNEIKNSPESDAKEFSFIDDCFFHEPVNKVELSLLNSEKTLQLSNNAHQEQNDFPTHKENLDDNELIQIQSMNQNKVTNITECQKAHLSFIDQQYFSASVEKSLNDEIKNSTISEVMQDSCYFQNDGLAKTMQNEDIVSNQSSITFSRWNKKDEVKTTENNVNNLVNNNNVTNSHFFVDKSSENKYDRIRVDQNNLSQIHKDINFKIPSDDLLHHEMSSKNKDILNLNKLGSVKELVSDKNSDHFYESILKSSKQVNINIKSAFQEEGHEKSSDYGRMGSYLDSGKFSRSTSKAVKSSNLDTSIKVRKISENSLQYRPNDAKEIETAHDFVSKLREENKILHPQVRKGVTQHSETKYDSKGSRILSSQVQDFSFCTRDEILEVLLNSVLYSDDDLIVLNKPYNIIIHDSKTKKEPCLSNFLNDMAKELDKKNSSPQLFTVHRIDKETTGCFLLARNELAAQNLKSLFAQRKIVKTYWIVTIRVPDPVEGVIDIPIAEGKVDKKARMVLQPDIPKDINYKPHCRGGKRAVTRYKVISVSGSAALVEVKPETGIKHQIRAHFGFGLSCPILGDHKYSHLSKLAPQKLSGDLLQRLRVRQSKVRHIPLHIHSRSILIPEYHNGRNLFVMAPLPHHMSENLQSLKFKKKK